MPREEVYVRVAKNALLIAGHEMGRDGDHWPAIKAAIYGITREFEALTVEEDVSAELETHLQELINRYATVMENAPVALQKELRPIIDEMQEVYNARFEPVAPRLLLAAEPAIHSKNFIPWRTAAHILEETGEI